MYYNRPINPDAVVNMNELGLAALAKIIYFLRNKFAPNANLDSVPTDIIQEDDLARKLVAGEEVKFISPTGRTKSLPSIKQFKANTRRSLDSPDHLANRVADLVDTYLDDSRKLVKFLSLMNKKFVIHFANALRERSASKEVDFSPKINRMVSIILEEDLPRVKDIGEVLDLSMLNTLYRNHICVFCLTGMNPDSSILDGDNRSLLCAMAKAHNHEQHSLNGNSLHRGRVGSRYGKIAECIKQAWDVEGKLAYFGKPPQFMLDEYQEAIAYHTVIEPHSADNFSGIENTSSTSYEVMDLTGLFLPADGTREQVQAYFDGSIIYLGDELTGQSTALEEQAVVEAKQDKNPALIREAQRVLREKKQTLRLLERGTPDRYNIRSRGPIVSAPTRSITDDVPSPDGLDEAAGGAPPGTSASTNTPQNVQEIAPVASSSSTNPAPGQSQPSPEIEVSRVLTLPEIRSEEEANYAAMREYYQRVVEINAEKQNWVCVGVDETITHVKLTRTATTEAFIAILKDPESLISSVINTRPTTRSVYGLVGDAGLRAISGALESGTVPADWRPLGLKLKMYDLMRESVMTNPSGVAFDFPRRVVPAQHVVINPYNDWGYEAVFLSDRSLDWFLVAGRIPIEGGDSWSFKDDGIKIIRLRVEDFGSVALGLGLKCMAHLQYPLAQVWQWQEMHVQNKHRLFCHTAGLVSMMDHAKKIIFLVAGQHPTEIQVANHIVPISKLEYRGFVQPAVPVDFDEILYHCISITLASKVPLTEKFSQSWGDRVAPVNLDWGEITMSAAMLIERWAPQPEITLDNSQIERPTKNPNFKANYCDPAEALKTRDEVKFLGGSLTFNLAHKSAKNYFRGHQVSATDFVFKSRPVAEQYPHLRMGFWSNLAEIITGLGICTFNPFNVERSDTIRTSMLEGAYAIKAKAYLLRKAFEIHKNDICLHDYAVQPRNLPAGEADGLLSGFQKGSSQRWFMSLVMSRLVTRWSWAANLNGQNHDEQVIQTETGSRLPVVSLLNLEEDKAEGYKHSVIRNNPWRTGMYEKRVQEDRPRSATHLVESMLKVNPADFLYRYYYTACDTGELMKKVTLRVDKYNWQAYQNEGWRHGVAKGNEVHYFAWLTSSIYREWSTSLTGYNIAVPYQLYLDSTASYGMTRRILIEQLFRIPEVSKMLGSSAYISKHIKDGDEEDSDVRSKNFHGVVSRVHNS